jgi:hypothetical protein
MILKETDNCFEKKKKKGLREKMFAAFAVL